MGVLTIMVLGTATLYVMTYLNNNRIQTLRAEINAFESSVSEVRERTAVNNAHKNELDTLIKHGLDIEAAPTITENLMIEIINYTGPAAIILTVYDYEMDTRFGVHTLTLQGHAPLPESPLVYAEMLRTLPLIEEVSISNITANTREASVGFRVTCILRGVENENP
jgi:hypothetical protein